MLWFPLLMIFTPSPTMSVQSILFALMAPVRYGDIPETPIRPIQPESEDGKKSVEEGEEGKTDPRRSSVAGGDTVRDCAIIECVQSLFLPPFVSKGAVRLTCLSLPPVLCDPAVAKAHYEKIEKEVEAGVKQSQTREKAFPPHQQTDDTAPPSA